MTDLKAHAQKLKAEGNALFVKSQFLFAHRKYTEAIRHDDKNAILYANRAACALHQGVYTEAKYDAQKAVELDPTYAKGWSRLAASCKGLHQYEESVECWRKAIAALPSGNMTPSETKQKEQFEAGLKTVHDCIAQDAAFRTKQQEMKGIMPWDRAKAMESELQARLPQSAGSSAWPLILASKLWDNAIGGMKRVQTPPGPKSPFYGGLSGMLSALTNAILTEPRIFRMDEPHWLDMYQMQEMVEMLQTDAWATHSAEEVMLDALIRQRQKGWDVVRPALDVTVRVWVMKGLVALYDEERLDPATAVRRFDAIIRLIDWGRSEEWKDIPAKDKGMIFRENFIRGICRLRLEAMMMAYERTTEYGNQDTLQSLYNEAAYVLDTPDESLAELRGMDFGTSLGMAWFIHPKATGYVARGFYHQEMASPRQARGKADVVSHHLFEAYQAYREAAMLYPKDDEKRAWYLHLAIGVLFKSDQPFDLVLRTTEELRSALTDPNMKRIWENSRLGQRGMYEACEQDLQLEKKILEDLSSGKIKLADHMPSHYFESSS